MSWLRILAYTIAAIEALLTLGLAALFCRHAAEEHARESSGEDEREGLRIIRGEKS